MNMKCTFPGCQYEAHCDECLIGHWLDEHEPEYWYTPPRELAYELAERPE